MVMGKLGWIPKLFDEYAVMQEELRLEKENHEKTVEQRDQNGRERDNQYQLRETLAADFATGAENFGALNAKYENILSDFKLVTTANEDLARHRELLTREIESLMYELGKLAEEQAAWKQEQERYRNMQADHQGIVAEVTTERDDLQAVVDGANAELERRTTMLSKRARTRLGLAEEAK